MSEKSDKVVEMLTGPVVVGDRVTWHGRIERSCKPDGLPRQYWCGTVVEVTHNTFAVQWDDDILRTYPHHELGNQVLLMSADPVAQAEGWA